MKKCMLIGLFQSILIVSTIAQSFTYHSDAPFGIKLMHEDSSRVANKVMFFDFDGDDDLDLFLSGVDNFGDFESWESIVYFIEMQENTGDKWNPQFADRVEPFANFPFPLGYFFPAIGDVNNDGDPDFVIFGDVNFFGGRTILYLESDGRSAAGFNVIRGDAFELEDFVPESFFVPELVDLDQDGDLDILMSGADPAFAEENGADVPTYYYARNREVRSGSSAAEFQGWYWNPYGLTPNPLAEILTSGDIDNDGDVDLLGAALLIPQDSMNHIYVHLNTPGTSGKPAFDETLQSPFGLPSSFGEAQFLFPDLVDMDGDGDLDLFVFQVTAQGNILQYYENTMCELDNSVSVADHVLTANHAGAAYQWIDCDTGADIPGATGQSYEVLVTGNYAVNVTDAANCSVISECVFIMITSVLDQEYSNAITIYPNPADELMYVFNTSQFPVSTVTLTNLSGQVVGEFFLSDKNAVDVCFLGQGVYFVKIKTKEFEIIRKLVVI